MLAAAHVVIFTIPARASSAGRHARGPGPLGTTKHCWPLGAEGLAAPRMELVAPGHLQRVGGPKLRCFRAQVCEEPGCTEEVEA